MLGPELHGNRPIFPLPDIAAEKKISTFLTLRRIATYADGAAEIIKRFVDALYVLAGSQPFQIGEKELDLLLLAGFRVGEPVKNVVLIVANRRERLVTDTAPVQTEEKLIQRHDYIRFPGAGKQPLAGNA
jgi:hypothetical protein